MYGDLATDITLAFYTYICNFYKNKQVLVKIFLFLPVVEKCACMFKIWGLCEKAGLEYKKSLFI